jgi:pyruvate dehydrogenase (quinone)
VDQPEKVGAAWELALAADRPVVLEAITDPNIPPLPPDIGMKNAKAFASTLFKGDPEELSVVSKTVKQMAAELLPG